MAATCATIVTYAMRQCRILGVGKDPKSAELEEGMAALQSLYDDWRTGGMFGRLKDVYLTGDATAQEGRRYYIPAGVTLIAATNDYVPACGADYDFDGCDYGSGAQVTRQPRDLALYETVDSGGTQTAKLYDRIGWVDLLNLQSTDIAPLSGRSAYGLAGCLASSGGFVSAFGADPPAPVVALARHFLASVMGKTGSTEDAARLSYL